ncbi:MAG: glycosyltransferase family 4 protein [Paludibacteraceae bacterium]|nr:glycosyltransferase family 4 protein [Paludibacteraceae bacterium]
MKILIVGNNKPGHFAPFVEEQARALQQQGCEVVFYGVKGKGLLGYLRALPALCRTIRAEQPEIVHAHYGLSGLLANLQRRVPVVTTYHGSDINKPNILRFSKIAMRLSAHNIFVSQRNVTLALSPNSLIPSRLKKRYTLLPCGVNIPKPWSEMQTQQVEQLTLNQWVQEKLTAGVKHVLFAGAFNNAVKDPELAKAVINELASEGVKVELIELKGFNRDQVNALMYNCDVLLMTSKTEGSPQVIKEAMACGRPIVSVDVGDVAERLSGVEGCYVACTREPNEIAKALQKALTFEGKTNGREKIIEIGLSNEQVAQRLVAIYESVLA